VALKQSRKLLARSTLRLTPTAVPSQRLRPGPCGETGSGDPPAASPSDQTTHLPHLPDFQHNLLDAIPRLRAFAIGLCGRPDAADDLVQDTLVRAWANTAAFQPGTHLMAWLYTILRNAYYSEFRKRRHEVADPDGQFAAMLVIGASQDSHIEFQECCAALDHLQDKQREALLLVGAAGVSYEAAARICNCAVGTLKSRIHRARASLENSRETTTAPGLAICVARAPA
jgi:RNA polymerase sigma-70 factor (ECF subfamily)